MFRRVYSQEKYIVNCIIMIFILLTEQHCKNVAEETGVANTYMNQYK